MLSNTVQFNLISINQVISQGIHQYNIAKLSLHKMPQSTKFCAAVGKKVSFTTSGVQILKTSASKM